MKKIVCKAGDVCIGDGKITVQSMCNTDTLDVAASVAQCKELADAGCEMIRLTTQGLRQVRAFEEIRRQLRSEGVSTPLVADVHFNSEVALAAAAGIADKVRINPGNFSKDHGVAMAKLRDLLQVCKDHGTALRIGLNHGSLGERITSVWGDTPVGMCNAIMEWLRVCVDNDFYNLTLSLKASNTKVMVEAYELLYQAMQDELGMLFPLHLGVTEAGNGDSGRMKSAVGIGSLLKQGIGDTIRVSLTENPVNEIPVARMLVHCMEDDSMDAASREEYIVRTGYRYGKGLLEGGPDDFTLQGSIAGRPVTPEEAEDIKDILLQASRRRFTKAEYIACPSCGRTLYDIESVLAEVRKATERFAGVRIAVMGCIVNGPGEMADADYGYVGQGVGKVTLYKGRTPVEKDIPQNEAVSRLVALIENDKLIRAC
ncbi:MAG: (E)-4-hydroxy-3-methylbut-2-enyl-diphosphate synthase [Bacteroidales bacterium]|nr:(E)-4-hydroxy-3-methylbut-2-enyl-diphosphate synthase [Bacteroidales bacterium]